jgi:hypothetical protein
MAYTPAPSPHQTPAPPQPPVAHAGPTPGVAAAAGIQNTPPRPLTHTVMPPSSHDHRRAQVPIHVQFEPADDRSRSRDGEELDNISAMMQNMVYITHHDTAPAFSTSNETYETAQGAGQGPHIVERAEPEEDQNTHHV